MISYLTSIGNTAPGSDSSEQDSDSASQTDAVPDSTPTLFSALLIFQNIC